jgi:hypothetical protein
MLLEALVACAGVTVKAVATALDIPLRSGVVSAEGELDFRGTLGVAKDAAVGSISIPTPLKTSSINCSSSLSVIAWCIRRSRRGHRLL